MSAAIALTDVFRVHRGPEGDAAALQGLSLEIARGRTVAILGPSGAGKSTLLRVVAGLETPSAGVALVLGEDVGRASARRRAAFRHAHLGFVDQHHERALAPSLRLADGVAAGALLRGAPRAEAHRRAAMLLERVGLGERLGARPGELSGGERQRAAVAAALVHEPAIVLADEPGGELDEPNAIAVYDLLCALAREHGATVVIVSHDPAAAAATDRAYRLRDGRISEELIPGGGELAVVARGGWVHLPGRLGADEGDRLETAREDAAIVLRPAPGPAAPIAPEAAPPAASPARPGVPAELRGVGQRYGSRVVLSGWNARFAPGRLTVLSGPSGSGKTTVLALLAGLRRADAGEVLVGEEELGALDRAALARLRRATIGVVRQDLGLVAVPLRRGERRARARGRGEPPGHGRAAGGGGARRGRPLRPGRPGRRAPVRRRAAAHRHRPRPRGPPRAPARGRADLPAPRAGVFRAPDRRGRRAPRPVRRSRSAETFRSCRGLRAGER